MSKDHPGTLDKLPKPMDFRVPPQDLEAEQSVLGAMMLSEQATITAQQTLKEADFYREVHRKIFNAIVVLHRKAEPVDVVTLSGELKRVGAFEQIGGINSLTELLDRVPTAANAEYYIELVKEAAKKRELIYRCANAEAEAYQGEAYANQIVEKLVDQIMTDENIQSTLEPTSLASSAYENVTDPKKTVHIPTGFPILDETLGGIRRGVFGTVTGQSETGKSTLCANIAVRIAKKKFKVAIATYEDKPERYVNRQVCLMNDVKIERLESKDPAVMDFGDKANIYAKWSELGIRVVGRRQIGITWRTLKLWMLREWKRNKIDMFFIDGGERLFNQPTYGETRYDAQERMVVEIEDLAQSMDVGIWVIVGQAKTSKNKFMNVDEDEGGTNAWRKMARQRLFVGFHRNADKDKAYENISVVKITKNSDGKKGSVWFQGDRDSYKWIEVEKGTFAEQDSK